MRQARRPGIFERPAWPDEGFGLACLSQAQAMVFGPGPVIGRPGRPLKNTRPPGLSHFFNSNFYLIN